MFYSKVVVFSFLFFLVVNAWSNSEPEAAAPKKDYSGAQSQEWQEIQTKVQAAKGKLEQQETLVNSLLDPKHAAAGGAGHGEAAGANTPNAGSESERIKTLKQEYKKMLNLTKEYNDLRDQLETRFPEKSAKEGRIYRRINPSSSESVENDMSFEGRLRRINKKIREKYPKSVAQELEIKGKTSESENKDHVKPEKIKADPKSDVTDPIILKK